MLHRCLLLFLAMVVESSIRVDYEGNAILLDYEPYQILSGSCHYFLIPRAYWADRLWKMKTAGLNTVSTYVEWSLHNPEPGVYDFDGEKDLLLFIRLAQRENLNLILRPGPYICAERDFGGFPYWLLSKYPHIRLRTSDPDYINEVNVWFEFLLPKIVPYLHGNGGPIIMVQVENEYGSYKACDKKYMKYLKTKISSYVRQNAILYTSDGNSPSQVACGIIEGVFATTNFGPDEKSVSTAFQALTRHQPTGPLMVSEFYVGWFTNWGESKYIVQTESIITMLNQLINDGVSINMYMFCGGTHFGFKAGSTISKSFKSVTTSYDYDAPVSESGHLTQKYFAVKELLSNYCINSGISLHKKDTTDDYGETTLKAVAGSFHSRIKHKMGKIWKAQFPLTFEELNLNSGYLLYEVELPPSLHGQINIHLLQNISDIANIFINKQYVGTISREYGQTMIQLYVRELSKIGIFVENRARLAYGNKTNEKKGITDAVLIEHMVLENWIMTSMPLDDISFIYTCDRLSCIDFNKIFFSGYIFYLGKFSIHGIPKDTFLNVSSLQKGVVFINNINLGRYWSSRGPTLSLYVPGVYLNQVPDMNKIVILEEFVKRKTVKVSFGKRPIMDNKPLKPFFLV